MNFCNTCQNITFEPLNEDPENVFKAVIHTNLLSLKRQAELRECRLCVSLYGSILHQRQAISEVGDDTSVSMSIRYKDESDDCEFDFIDFEIGLNDGDAPEYLLVEHPGLSDQHLRIHNPGVISRSALRMEGQDDEAPAHPCKIEDTYPSSGVLCHNTSTGSDTSMALLRSWITKCEKEHPTCNQKSFDVSSIYPERLLDVSSIEDRVGTAYLVESAKNNLDSTRPSYATLSHRWRPGHTCSTNSSNKSVYILHGIQATSLTKTFLEACITVHKLGLRYIWIDSLCIIQDSEDDKAREIPKMADYYQNALFNVAASTGEDNDVGLWQERDGEATRPFSLPITIITQTFPRKSRKIILTVSPVLRAGISHLDSRGWILQERILSRRTFFFDPYWVSFECGEMSASEACPQGIPKNINTDPSRLEANMATVISRNSKLSTIGGILRAQYAEILSGKILDEPTRRSVLKLWYTIISEYCNHDLTHESDRLNAISSLAGRLSQILDDTYVAGMWKQNLLQCLWWGPDISSETTNNDARQLIRTTKCGAPTWSWASVCPKNPLGKSRRYLFHFASSLPLKPLVQIIDVKWTPNGANKQGNISSAELILSGNLLRGYAYVGGREAVKQLKDLVTIPEDLKSRPPNKQRPDLHNDYDNWLVRLCAESSGQRDVVIVPMTPDIFNDFIKGFVYLLPLAESIGPMNWEYGEAMPDVPGGQVFSLILKEKEGEKGIFERVGYVESNAGFLMAVNDRVITLI